MPFEIHEGFAERGQMSKFCCLIIVQRFKTYQIKSLPVPRYPELKVDNCWKWVESNPFVIKYFPDYTGSTRPERKFMYDVVYTLSPNLLFEKVQEAHSKRRVKEQLGEEELIEIKGNLLKEIKDSIYQSSKYYLIAI